MSSEPKTENITLASNVLGTVGTVLWCIQLLPQIWSNWRRKDTEGFPQLMMLLWGVCAVPMGAYFFLQEVNIPLQIQPQVFGFFSLVAWGQILHYTHKFSCIKATAMVVGAVALFGGIEAALVLSLRIPYNKGITWPDMLVGVIAAICLAGGLIPPYFELAKRGGRVVGINWFFLGTDALGGLFSLFALAAQGTFDILGGILYTVVVLLEIGIIGSHIIWRIRYRKLLAEAKITGKTIDEMLGDKEVVHSRGSDSGVESQTHGEKSSRDNV